MLAKAKTHVKAKAAANQIKTPAKAKMLAKAKASAKLAQTTQL